MKKSLTVIFNKMPYGSQASRELLDIALMASAFDMPINAVFIEDGVFQLLKNQQPDILMMKNHSSTFKAMPLYGIENILIDKSSLESRNINHSSLLEIGEQVNYPQIKDTIADSEFVFCL